MALSEEVRRVLRRLDVRAFRAGWPTMRPGQPAPRTDDEALVVMHAARVLCDAIPARMRRYSHAWLSGRGIDPPLALHQLVEPPRIVGVTGISVNAGHPEIVRGIEGAMVGALLESEAEGDPDAVTRERMQVARHRERRGLGLRPLVG